MRILSLIFFLYICTYCFGQKLMLPEGYQVLDEKNGDLDKDGVEEKVLICNTTDTIDYGIVREIQIYKKKGDWVIWKRSKNAILKSNEGGAFGDPFESIEIKNGILLINYYGGSSWKWSYTDKFRFQNKEFELIGHTNNSGRNCEYWLNFDYNLTSGKIILTKEFEACENDNITTTKTEKEIFIKKIPTLNLNNRNKNEKIKIVSPLYKYELFL